MVGGGQNILLGLPKGYGQSTSSHLLITPRKFAYILISAIVIA